MFSLTKKSHFTFMECIAVMVIIIVLTVILMPAAMKARELCKSITCKNNMKTIAQALMTYAQDRQGALPESSIVPNTAWPSHLTNNGYLPSPKMGFYVSRYYTLDYKTVFSCPSQPIYWKNKWLADSCGRPAGDTAYFNWERTHYSMSGPSAGSFRAAHYNIFSVIAASKLAFVRDSLGANASTIAPYSFPYPRHIGFQANYNLGNYSNFTVYHGNALINLITFDGSAKSIHTLEYSKYSW